MRCRMCLGVLLFANLAEMLRRHLGLVVDVEDAYAVWPAGHVRQ